MLTKFLIKIGSFLAIMTGLIFYGYYFSDPADKFLFFSISITAIFAFGATAILLVRHVLSEVKKFTKNTDLISDDGKTLLKIENNDELGQLGNSINKLSEKFIEKSKNYELKISELENKDSELQNKIHYLDETKRQLNQTISELTEQKKIEKRYLRELEWRSNIVTNLIEEAKKADQLKSEFTSMISHELKTPLTPIISWCSILEQDAYGVLNPKQRQSIEKIHHNADKLVTMVGDLLDARKLDLGKMAFVFSDLSSCKIIQSVFDEYESIMNEKNIDFSLSCNDDYVVYGDQNRIEQVLKNFIINAIDFVPENGKIEIATKRNDPYVTFYVKDNGIGISKENQKKLFQKFYQVNASTTREHGGSGLGLSICKGIVRSMDGLIGVESNLGDGSIFYFSLPIKDLSVSDAPPVIDAT